MERLNEEHMKTVLRLTAVLVLLFVCRPLFAFQIGEADFAKAETKVIPVRGNITLIQIHVPQDVFHIAVLSGPEGYLLVDHPEAAGNPLVQKALAEIFVEYALALRPRWRQRNLRAGRDYCCA